MKTLSRVATIVWLLVPMSLIAGAPDRPVLNAPGNRIFIHVKGLACPFCAYGLQKHLGQVPGVQTVRVSIKRGVATVVTFRGKSVSHKALRAAVKKAGFTVQKITLPGATPPKGASYAL